MELVLDRDVRTVRSTMGKLFVNGLFECFTLEDVDRGLKITEQLQEIEQRKIKNETCIPEGEYQVIINFSNRFQKPMPLLVNVPGYDGIRIHPGNTDKNTSGCILVGVGRKNDALIQSVFAFEKLEMKLKTALDNDEKVFLTIQQ